MEKLSHTQKVRSALQIVIGGQVVAFGLATYAGDERWYRSVLMPAMQIFGAETSHKLAVKAAKYGLVPRVKNYNPPCLKTGLWGCQFSNPIGLAAGFDKDGECVDGMLRSGFGFVEVGTVTPEPQPGNAQPRVFRLKQDKAVINRYGFNSDGHEAVHNRLIERLKSKIVVEAPDDRNQLNENMWSPDRPRVCGIKHPVPGLVGVNLGKNKTSSDAVADYVKGVNKFSDVADYLVINISSPNTPGLRDMQGRKQLKELVSKVVCARNGQPADKQRPLLVKIAPDLSQQDKEDIAAVVLEGGVDGLIVTNTTVTRPDTLTSPDKEEVGGLSGQPLKDMSTAVIGDMYKLTQGRIPIVGVGGVASGKDAYEKIRAGASVIQLYTALGYEGPPLVNKVKRELAQLIEQDGFSRVSEAVGSAYGVPGSRSQQTLGPSNNRPQTK